MFLLMTGASGVGKTTARLAIEGDLAPKVACVEFADVVPIPDHMTIAWRHQSVEAVVQRAVALQADDRNLLLCGDPVAVGEVLAAPSAIELDAIAV